MTPTGDVTEPAVVTTRQSSSVNAKKSSALEGEVIGIILRDHIGCPGGSCQRKENGHNQRDDRCTSNASNQTICVRIHGYAP